jgi:hypothetical protein
MLFLKDLDYEDIVVFDTKMVILKKIHLRILIFKIYRDIIV